MTLNKAVVFCVLLLPCLALCGKIPSSVLADTPDSRIMNGFTAEPGQFPYQVSLRYIVNRNHFCGGAIIHQNWVATAYHCVNDTVPGAIIVVAGTTHLFNDGTDVAVEQIYNHPDAYYNEYDPTNLRFENDISLLRTATITFGPTISVIGIAPNFVGAGVPVTISGWGNYAWPNHILPENLQFLPQVTLSNIDCRSRHAYLSHVVNDGHLCAFASRGQGICFGDSGGPLVANGQLVGLVSWLQACAQGRPDGYVRISVFADWISETMAL